MAFRSVVTLSRRESEVAELVRDGLTNREIANRLFISERTVEGHVAQPLQHLPLGREELVRSHDASRTSWSPRSRATSSIESTSSSVVLKLTKHGLSQTWSSISAEAR